MVKIIATCSYCMHIPALFFWANTLSVEASTSLTYCGSFPSIREQSCFVVNGPLRGRMNRLCRRDILSRNYRCQRASSHLFVPTFLSATLPCSIAASDFAAGGTLILSTFIGVFFEKIVTKSGGGHVFTLLMAALFSNISRVANGKSWIIPRVPTDHFLYDWCWSLFLPASLVFALLSSSSECGDESKMPTTWESAIRNNKDVDDITIDVVKGMALPFVMASLGSILGCAASFQFINVPPPSTKIPTRYSSAILAGCLCASYIGGTVNFFATANLSTSLLGDKSISMGSLFGSMAAADLVVMAFYFALLGTASKSEWLHRLFPNRYGIGTKDISKNPKYDDPDNVGAEKSDEERHGSGLKSSSAIGAIIASCIALACVYAATQLEKLVTKLPSPYNLPGTMCAFLALLGLLSDKCIGAAARMVTSKIRQPSTGIIPHLYHTIGQISATSPVLSDLCFYFLFAAVGTTADVLSALSGGPMALAFASLALVIHAFIAFFGTLVGSSVIGQWGIGMRAAFGNNMLFRWPCTSWEEVLTASNAAIGGPSTAAAFAAGLVPKTRNQKNNAIQNKYKRGLVLGATIWGVFGYAMGTSIGFSVTKVMIGL